MIKLSVPGEEGIAAANEFKHLRYSDVATEARKAGCVATTYVVEIGCCCFVGGWQSTGVAILQTVGVTGVKLQWANKQPKGSRRLVTFTNTPQ